jgi:hypothetical protein
MALVCYICYTLLRLLSYGCVTLIRLLRYVCVTLLHLLLLRLLFGREYHNENALGVKQSSLFTRCTQITKQTRREILRADRLLI